MADDDRKEKLETKTSLNLEDFELDLKFNACIIRFLLIYVGSFFIPGIIIILYIYLFFIPNFLHNANFIALFTEIEPLLAVMLMPVILMGSYILHLCLVGVMTRIFWRDTERKSPSKDGIIPRNVASKTMDYYNIRAFIIKYGKNCFNKGPFPWLSNWFYNFVGSNEIGKGTTIEEQVCGDKFCEVGKNCYLGPNSVLTTHLVEGFYGQLPYFKIKLGDNCTFTALGCIAPGGNLGDNTYLLPYASAFKFSQIDGKGHFYYGLPLRKIFTKRVSEYLQLSKEDLKKEKELRIKQKQDHNKMEELLELNLLRKK